MTLSLKTDHPILQDRAEITHKIAAFWNQTSAGWRAIWGPHLHHGYYEKNVALSPLEAQENLLHKITDKFHIEPRCLVLDVGCGMGGSSIYLAKKFAAVVTGITLSQKQIAIATEEAHRENISNIQFKIEDALSLASFEDDSFDVVWSLESCEQFFDKKLFLEQAYRVLKPGGKLMLATWCSSCEEYTGTEARKYQNLCEAFDLPYMPTINHYRTILEKQNFIITETLDWTAQVENSWKIGLSLTKAFSFWQLFKLGGLRGLKMVKQLKFMQQAFHEKRVKYGVFLASKPK
jgi:tocopherol O-methyltransferase